jgi:hypothetical protein
MYEKYRFTTCMMVYVPAVASIVGGQMISYWELDPTDTFGASGDLQQDLRVALAHQNSKLHNVYDTVSVALPLRTGITDFFVERASTPSDSLRWTRQATYRMIASAGLTGFLPSDVDSMVVGSIYLRWATTFKNPQIQPSLTVPITSVDDAFRRPTGTDRLYKIKGVTNYITSNTTTPTTYFALDGTPVDTVAYFSGILPDGFMTFDNVSIILDEQMPKSYASQDDLNNLYTTAMYRLKNADKTPAFPVYSTQKVLGLSNDSDSASTYFVVEDLDTGEVILSLTTSSFNSDAYRAPQEACSWYSLPCLKTKIVDGVINIYSFVKDNEKIFSGAWTLAKGLAELIALTAAYRADIKTMGLEAAFTKHYFRPYVGVPQQVRKILPNKPSVSS